MVRQRCCRTPEDGAMGMTFRVRSVFRLTLLLGAWIWIVLALISFSPRVHLGIIEVLFLLGPWVVVPLGSDLLPSSLGAKSSALRDWVFFAAASLTTLSFFVDGRIVASWFASAWLLVCCAFAGNGLRRFVLRGTKSLTQFCFAAGEGYLLVAGVWLVASRAGVQLLAFREPIVLLTAVHFHFAGFASAVLAGLLDQALVERTGRRILRVGLVAVVLGPGILGLAFLLGPRVKLAAALLIALGQLVLAVGMVRAGLVTKNRAGRGLLLVAAGSVALGMIFAAVWAIGEYPLQAFVNIRQMAEFHGVMNAVGFAVCGLTGWTVLKGKRADLVAKS
jgi:YndJ-like protein